MLRKLVPGIIIGLDDSYFAVFSVPGGRIFRCDSRRLIMVWVHTLELTTVSLRVSDIAFVETFGPRIKKQPIAVVGESQGWMK